MSTPTRLPYGLSFVKPSLSAAQTGQFVLQTGTATPDVSMGTWFLANASSTTITNFRGGERGKLLYISCNTGGVVVIQNSAGGIVFNNIVGTTSAGGTITFTTGGNITMHNNETMEFIHDGTEWVAVSPRFVLSTQA